MHPQIELAMMLVRDMIVVGCTIVSQRMSHRDVSSSTLPASSAIAFREAAANCFAHAASCRYSLPAPDSGSSARLHSGRTADLDQRLLDRLGAIPGVRSAALAETPAHQFRRLAFQYLDYRLFARTEREHELLAESRIRRLL
jgi:hypothetical protein